MGYERKERLTRNILMMLTVGTFSIIPVAEGAPVLDNIETPGTHVQQAGGMTDVTSEVKNNIVNWKDFSVDKGETVRFDKGEKTNNYLNVVTGDQSSKIRGAIQGGNDVYIVNPQGIQIDKGATVNVGNLYLSTTPPENLSKDTFANDGSSPLVNTAASAAGNVVNMGKIEAKTVNVEGGIIKFLDTADVSATGSDVKLTANDAILLGQNTVSTSTSDNEKDGVSFASVATPAGTSYQTNVQPTNYEIISKKADFDKIKTDPTKNYWLSDNIDMSGDTFTPISTFSGILDGNFFEIQGLTVSATGNVGLFSNITGTADNHAKIYDLGLRDVSITKNDKANGTYAGGLAGTANYADITNVYVSGGTITARSGKQSGGILGSASNVNLESVYNTANVGASGSGLVVYLGGNVSIRNAYNAGVAKQPIYLLGSGVSTNTLTNVYADTRAAQNAGVSVGNGQGAADGNLQIITNDNASTYMHAATFSDWLDEDKQNKEVSSEGGKNTVWRIYEGYSLPLLRAFLIAKGGGTVAVNYDYTMGDKTGSKTGTDDLTLEYNNNDLTISNLKGLVGTKEVDSSLIQKAQDFHNANTYSGQDADGNLVAETDASKFVAYYCDQDGYDLVGNNVKITPITVSLTNVLGKKNIDKEYDGTSAVSKDGLQKLFNSSTSSGTGILKGDTTASIGLSDDFAASYRTKDGDTYTETKDVGKDRYIYIDKGGASLTYNGAYNYILSSDSSSLVGQAFGGNTITQKKVYVDLGTTLKDKTNVKKTYNKSSALPTSLTLSKDSFVLDTSQFVDKDPTDSTKGKEEVSLAFASGSPTGEYAIKNADYTYTSSGTASQDKDVAYTGIMLSGKDADNYVLIDASTKGTDNERTIWQAQKNDVGSDVNKTTGGTLFGKGIINKRAIGDTGYSWYKNGEKQTATREYNGETTYTDSVGNIVKAPADSTSDTGVINGDSVTMTVQSANFIQSTDGSDKTTTKNVKNAKGVAYEVKVTGDAIENYTIGGNDITANQTNTVYGEGSITPRTLNVVAKSGVDKYYDGDSDVKVNGSKDLTFGGDQVAYADATDTAHHLLSNDTNAKITVTGTYDSPNVKWSDATDNATPTAQGIKYVVQVKEGNDVSENYAFNADGETTATLTSSGTIKPKAITKVAFQDVSKIYDQTNTVNKKQTTDQIVLDEDKTVGLVNSEKASDILDISNVTGTYGTYDSTKDAFTANDGGHVMYSDAAQTQVASQDVQYKNLALKNKHGNYKLETADEGGKAYDTVYGTGTINPLEITDASTINLAIDKNITKVYDNSTSVANGENTAASYVGKLTAKIPDSTDSITLGYTVADANYASKNSKSKTKQNVTYNLNITADAEGHKDYTIADNLLVQDGTYKGTLEKTLTDAGVITPLTLQASVTNQSLDKDYDTTTTLKGSDGNELKGDKIVTLKNLLNDGTQNASTGKYTSEDVNYDSNGNVISRGITYTAAISGGDDPSNYTIDKTSLPGNGIISPASLTLKLGPSSKTYDGTTAVASNVTASVEDVFDADKDKVKINLNQAKSAYIDTKKAGDAADKGENKKVKYVFTLSGDKVKNYKLTTDNLTDSPAKLNTEYSKTTSDNSITKFILSKDDVAVDWGDITKVYDGLTDVGYDHNDTSIYFTGETGKKTSEDFINYTANDATKTGLKLGGISIARGTGYTVTDDATYGAGNAGVGTHTATFHLSLNSTVQNNFDFSALTKENLYSDGTLTATHDGTITQKTLKTTFKDSEGGNVTVDGKLTGAVTKVYNGSTNVVKNSQTDVKTGNASDSSLFTSKFGIAGLVNGEKQADVVNLSGAYEGPNVTATKVNYTVATNADSNYTLLDASDATKTGSSLSYEGAGSITKKALTVSDVSVADKTFDTNANVKNVSNITYTLDGLVDGDSLTLDKDTIAKLAAEETPEFTGTYDDENVNRTVNAETGTAGTDSQNVAYYYKGVKYTGFQNVLDKMYEGGKTIAGNYSIANTAYFDEAKKKGIIRPLSITADAVRETWSDITKTYDADADVENAKDKLKYNVLVSSTGTVKGKDASQDATDTLVSIDYKLDSATYNQSDAGKGLKATYEISDFTGASLGNFVMGDEVKNVVVGEHSITGGDSNGKDVSITPKVIDVALTTTDGINKVYNGETDSTFVNGITIDDGKDDGNVSGETNKVKVALESTTGTYDEANHGDRTLTYTVKLTGNDKGNYTLGTIDKTTGKGTQNSKDLQAAGTISQRKVYVDFTNGQPTGIVKTYDGTADVTDAATKKAVQDAVGTLAATDTTGILQKDAENGVKLDAGNISVLFGDTSGEGAANVNRSAKDWSVQNKNVEVSNFGLLKNDKGNYVVEVNNSSSYLKPNNTKTLLAVGRIDPVKVTASLNATPVTKVYDGTTDVVPFTKDGVTYDGADNIKLTTDKIVGNQTVQEALAHTTVDGTLESAAFNSAHVNDAKTVTYKYDWTNPNYEISTGNVNDVTVLMDQDDSTKAIGKTVTLQTTGTIDPRKIKVAGAEDASKTYDGTTNVLVNKDGSALAVGKNIKFEGATDATLGVVDGDDVKATAKGTYLETATGKGDAADASTVGSSELLKHDVKYTDIAIGNTDYELVGDTEYTTTDQGSTIDRATLTLTGKKESITTGTTPTYEGTVTGWADQDPDKDKLANEFEGNRTWNKNPGEDPSKAGQYAINGWYKDNADGIQKGTDISEPDEQDTDNSTIKVVTTPYTDSTGTKTLYSVTKRTKDVTSEDPDDPTKTITTTEPVSTTTKLYNPIDSSYYTEIVTDADGKVTSQALVHVTTDENNQTVTTKTAISSIDNWYGTVTDANTGTAYAYDTTKAAPSTLLSYSLSGNFDKNYKFVQYTGDGETDLYGNAKALTVTDPSHHGGGGGGSITPVTPVTPSNPSNPSTPSTPTTPTTVPDISSDVNAAKQFVPNSNAYNNASHDDVQSVMRSGQAGLEYASGGINVTGESATPTVSTSSTDNAAIGLQDAGSVVNLSGGDAMEVNASRIDITGGDSFTITGDTQVQDSTAAIESTGAQTHESSAAIETAEATTKDAAASIETADATTKEASASVETTDLQSTTDGSWLFGDEAPASEKQSETSSSEDRGTSLFSNPQDDDAAAAQSAISVKTAEDTENADDSAAEDDKDKDKDQESSDHADDSSIGIESEGAGVNVA